MKGNIYKQSKRIHASSKSSNSHINRRLQSEIYNQLLNFRTDLLSDLKEIFNSNEYSIQRICTNVQEVANKLNSKKSLITTVCSIIIAAVSLGVGIGSLINSINEWINSGPVLSYTYTYTNKHFPIQIFYFDHNHVKHELSDPHIDSYRIFISNHGRLSTTILSLEAINKYNNASYTSTCSNQAITINPGQTLPMIASFGNLNDKFKIKSLKAITGDDQTIPLSLIHQNKKYTQIVKEYANNSNVTNEKVICDINYVGSDKKNQ